MVRRDRRARSLLTPVSCRGGFELSNDSDGLAYWKQILPDRTITYRGQQLPINSRVHRAAIRAFRAKALPQTAFLLANADNAHTMDPERFRGDVVDMRLARPGENPGLYAKIKFANAKAAQAVLSNPNLGVSCRLEQYLERNGKTYEAAVVHVLGTLDPVVPDMSPWQPVDLSAYDSARTVIDLSGRSYDKEKKVAKRKTTKKSGADSDTIDLSEALDTLDEMSDEELDELIGDLETEIEADTEADEDDDTDDGDDDLVDEDDEDDESDDEDDDLVDDGSDEPADDKPVTANLSRKQRRQIDLANSQANEANARALRALRQLSDTNWENTRDRLVRSGLPPALVDLAEPFIHTTERTVIDLSNGTGKKLDVAKRVERILDTMAGYIKLGGGKGHGVDLSNTDDGKLSNQDQAMLDAWNAAYPT